jgi:hypothetical protein
MGETFLVGREGYHGEKVAQAAPSNVVDRLAHELNLLEGGGGIVCLRVLVHVVR